MESSWLAPVKGKRNVTRWSDAAEGWRPSGEALVEMVDTADPAFMHIAAALQEFKDAGVELDQASVAVAIQLGRRRREAAELIPRNPRIASNQSQPIVYYVRRGSLVKIGTTASPRKRFAELIPDEILAVEPGERDLEQQRHAEFGALRLAQSEYFHAAPALLDYARKLRDLHGAPDPDWPTMATIGSTSRFDWTKLPLAGSAEMATIPDGVRLLGIQYHTAYGWVRRGRLVSVGKDPRGVALYLVDHMVVLAARGKYRSRSAA